MDTTALSEVISVGKLIIGLNALMNITVGVFAIAAFFRRQPSIDTTLTALIKEFNQQLQDRVLVRDFKEAEGRHAQQIRDVEARIDGRMAGLQDAIVALRASSERVLIMLQDIYKDGGWTRGRLEAG